MLKRLRSSCQTWRFCEQMSSRNLSLGWKIISQKELREICAEEQSPSVSSFLQSDSSSGYPLGDLLCQRVDLRRDLGRDKEGQTQAETD